MTKDALVPTQDAHLLWGVDAAPAQTWNWLDINATTFEVPANGASDTDDISDTDGVSSSSGKRTREELPRWAQDVRLACGDDARAWLSKVARSCVVAETDSSESRASGVTTFVGDAERELDALTVALRAKENATAFATIACVGAIGTSANALHIVAEAGSKVTVDILIARQNVARHLQAIGATLEKDSSLTLRVWVLGGAKTALSIACDLIGARSHFTSELRYLVGANESLDASYDVRQLGRLSEARIGASGVLTEGAAKTLRATIDLVRGCKGSVGSETETVLVAGENIRNKTLPVILCSEDDVQGDHGATIGSLSPEQTGYLQGRGLSVDDVVELAGQAIVDDAASQLVADVSAAVVAWTRATRGRDAAAQAADAAAIAHGTLCDPFAA